MVSCCSVLRRKDSFDTGRNKISTMCWVKLKKLPHHDLGKTHWLINRISPKQQRPRIQLRTEQGTLAGPREAHSLFCAFVHDKWNPDMFTGPSPLRERWYVAPGFCAWSPRPGTRTDPNTESICFSPCICSGNFSKPNEINVWFLFLISENCSIASVIFQCAGVVLKIAKSGKGNGGTFEWKRKLMSGFLSLWPLIFLNVPEEHFTDQLL